MSEDERGATIKREACPSGCEINPKWAFCARCGADLVEVEYIPAADHRKAMELAERLQCRADNLAWLYREQVGRVPSAFDYVRAQRARDGGAHA